MAALVFCAAGARAQDRAAPGAPGPAPTLEVREFRVAGNTLLPLPAIMSELERHKGSGRSLADLQQAAQAVQQLYAKAGYGAVVAFLPQQAPSDGIVTIQVLEGRIAAVNVSGNRQFSQENVRASVPALRVGATPQVKLIDAQLQIANENPSKKQQLLLQPGTTTGEVQASLTVTEEPVRRWSIALDNTGNDSTGRYRVGLGWRHANLWDRDHVLTAQVQTSVDEPDAVLVLSAGYRWPLYAQRLVLDAYAAYSDVEGVSTAIVAGDLQFAGKGRLAGVRLTRHLQRIGEVDHRLGVGLDHRHYDNACTIAGLPPGACGPAGESVAVQPLSLEYVAQRAGPTPLGLSVALLHNLQIGGGPADDSAFEAVRAGSKPKYTALRVSGFAGVAVMEDWRLQARMAGQFTDDALVPGEQFGIGGIASVRGYQERELAGDRGLFAALEFVAPNVASAVGLRGADLRALAFVDGGRVENRLDTPCTGTSDRCTLASVGAGVRLKHGPLDASVYVANARKAGPQTERDDSRGHFSVIYRF